YLVRRSAHRVSDRDFYSRRGCSWAESPPSERAGGGVIENRATYALRHRRVSDTAAGDVNSEDGDTATSDVTTAGFVGIIRFWRKNRDCFRARDRHRSSHPLRCFDRAGRFCLGTRWWRFFFVKLRRHFGNRWWLRNRNVFRRWGWLIFGLQHRFYRGRGNIRQIDDRWFVFHCRD